MRRDATWLRRLLLAGLVLVAAEKAVAQEQYFRVVGLGPRELRNIRERPDGDAPVVAAVPPRSRLRGFGCTANTPTGRTWCRVKSGDAVGWARETFLRPEG